jgi:hypothetical protein
VICVRVIMGVVNCRLDYKQFVLWYCSLPQFTVHAVCAERWLMFAIRKCRINWITWYPVNITHQLLMTFLCNDSIPQGFKLDLKTERFTVSCLSKTIHVIISTAMCHHSHTAQCIFIWKSADSHKVPRIPYSALSDIPVLTACHNTQSPLYNSSKYSMSCYSRLILHLGATILMVMGFTPRPLYLQSPCQRSLCDFLFRSAS